MEINANSLKEYLEAVKSIQLNWNPTQKDPAEVWFRGVTKRKYNLLPGIFRPNIVAKQFDEETLFETFKNISSSFVQLRPHDDWEWYFLAQHYGLCTRLLDWTESALAALYFAIANGVYDNGKTALHAAMNRVSESIFDDNSPCVWVMDAGSLNKATTGKDEIIAPGGSLTCNYLPGNLAAGMPIAIQPIRSNPRIVAQQGVFTVHGNIAVPLESCLPPDSGFRVAVIVIDRANIASIWQDIELCGISRLTYFPELQSVADYLKWIYETPCG